MISKTKDEIDCKNTILLIQAAAGGEEAEIFASELLRIYLKYADKKGWHLQIIGCTTSSGDGYKNVVLNLSGNGLYDRFKHESGIHSARRVPDNESSNRAHNSTAVVSVIPLQNDIDLEKLKQQDISVLKKLQDRAIDCNIKIRTYDYADNHVTDHRSNKSFSLKRVLEGDLDW